MSEIAAPTGSSGKTRSKKLSTRIDMTPMVDLAFLLLTFFILTNVLRNSFMMKIFIPDKPADSDPGVNAKRVLTLLLGEHNKIYWYTGVNPVVNISDFSKEGIRKIIMKKNAAIPQMLVLIKPSDKSHYKNLVDIFDEMEICKVKHYAMVDYTKEDDELIHTFMESAHQNAVP